MNEQKRSINQQKYQECLENMSGPVFLSEQPRRKIDFRGLRDYARQNGVPIATLSKEEIWLFVDELEE